SNLPTRRCRAPVKAPFSWPKSSLSTRLAGIAPQVSFTRGLSLRGLKLCMARGTGSFPVPGLARIKNAPTLVATPSYAPQNFLERGTPTDNLFEIMLCLDLLLEINVLDLQPVLELFDFSERRLKLIGGSFERLLGILALTNFLLHLVVQPGIFQRDRRLRR